MKHEFDLKECQTWKQDLRKDAWVEFFQKMNISYRDPTPNELNNKLLYKDIYSNTKKIMLNETPCYAFNMFKMFGMYDNCRVTFSNISHKSALQKQTWITIGRDNKSTVDFEKLKVKILAVITSAQELYKGRKADADAKEKLAYRFDEQKMRTAIPLMNYVKYEQQKLIISCKRVDVKIGGNTDFKPTLVATINKFGDIEGIAMKNSRFNGNFYIGNSATEICDALKAVQLMVNEFESQIKYYLTTIFTN